MIADPWAYLTSCKEFWITLHYHSAFKCSLLSASDMHPCLPVDRPQDMPSHEGWDTVLRSRGEHKIIAASGFA